MGRIIYIMQYLKDLFRCESEFEGRRGYMMRAIFLGCLMRHYTIKWYELSVFFMTLSLCEMTLFHKVVIFHY